MCDLEGENLPIGRSDFREKRPERRKSKDRSQEHAMRMVIRRIILQLLSCNLSGQEGMSRMLSTEGTVLDIPSCSDILRVAAKENRCWCHLFFQFAIVNK